MNKRGRTNGIRSIECELNESVDFVAIRCKKEKRGVVTPMGGSQRGRAIILKQMMLVFKIENCERIFLSNAGVVTPTGGFPKGSWSSPTFFGNFFSFCDESGIVATKLWNHIIKKQTNKQRSPFKKKKDLKNEKYSFKKDDGWTSLGFNRSLHSFPPPKKKPSSGFPIDSIRFFLLVFN